MKAFMTFVFIGAFSLAALAVSPKAALRVRVVDECGQPVGGLPVKGWFEDRDALGDYKDSVVTNLTGSDGMTRFSSRVYNGWIDYGDIETNGFYRIEGGRVNFTNTTGIVVEKRKMQQ